MSTLYSRITGTGSFLPERVVTNAQLVAELAQRGIETSEEWIVERTGIRQRHLAAPDVGSSALAVRAGRAAMQAASLKPQDIDLVVVATSTPDYVFPSTACLVQRDLGITQGAAYDIQAVCTGFIYALTTADAMIRTGMARHALVIGAEVFSRILDWNDRGTCVLFGDGAGAVVLSADRTPGILSARIHADGRYENILRTAGHVSGGKAIGHPFLTMDGQAVFKLAVGVLDSVGREVVEAAGLSLEQVDWLIPHQANVRIMQATARKLRMPLDKVVVTVDRHANTSAASVPLALDVAMREGRIQPGQHVLLEGVGGGFTWGAALARM